MTIGGWIFLVLSWSFIIGLCCFCLRRTLRKPR